VLIFLTTTEPENDFVGRLLLQMGAALTGLAPRYSVADSPASADAILFVESGRNKFAPYRRILLSRPEVAEYPGKCFIYDFTDRPAAFLPGLYTAMPLRRFNPSLMRPIPSSWDDTPDSVFSEAIARSSGTPYLFSFRGFRSASVRAELFSTRLDSGRSSITETTDWWNFDRSGQPRLDYLTEIRSTLFPLAPRGLGTTTLRLYEIMRLGRAPVILSDDWVPPPDIPWTDFSLRVSESRVPDLPEILEWFEPSAQEMGDAARQAWEKWCRPGLPLMLSLARGLEYLLLLRGPDFDGRAMVEEWSSQHFMWQHSWHPIQRAGRLLRNKNVGSAWRGRMRKTAP
jgi:hypothetical protein